MPGSVRRTILLPEADRSRLLQFEDLLKFRCPSAIHPLARFEGRGSKHSDAIELILRWARTTGASSERPDGWDSSRAFESKVWLPEEYADGRSGEELGILVHQGLSYYVRGTRVFAADDAVGRKIEAVERDVRLPPEEVRDVWWEAFRLRRDPRDVIAERMRGFVEDAILRATDDARSVWVTYPSDRRSEERMYRLEEIALDNGLKPDRYVEEAALRKWSIRNGPGVNGR